MTVKHPPRQLTKIVPKPAFLYDTLGTLCDEPNCLTCSFFIAREWNQAREIRPYETFEQAAAAVKAGAIDACLVAGAYPRLNGLIFDEALVVRETFLARIPPLVLVGFHDTIPDDLRVLYHHPATTPLLGETGLNFQPTELVSSNSVACKKLLDSPDDSMAITNQICSDYYKLRVFKVLRPGTVMPWIVFGRAGSVNYVVNHSLVEVVPVENGNGYSGNGHGAHPEPV